MTECSRWEQCYSTGWPKELLTEASWSHPAKFSYNLIQRIYSHAREEGWLPRGSHVIDPFAGVGLGCLEALRRGCSWAGVELEPPHFLTAQANIAKWMHEYRHLPGWGAWAMIVNGDSRDLLSHLTPLGGLTVSSPPYADGGKPDARHLHFDAARRNASIARQRAEGIVDSYGETPGNLANMAVSSPPYEGSVRGDMGAAWKGDERRKTHGTVHDSHYETYPDMRLGKSSMQDYGASAGQLGAMPPGMSVSSPPYGAEVIRDRETGKAGMMQGATQGKHAFDTHGHTVGQLADNHEETFWGAAREIVAQTYTLLRPGAHAIWVVKNYVRKKQIVDFCGQWRTLCEAVGFMTLHEHHAMLIEAHGRQEGLFGEETATVYETHRKSFFRRLLEAKGGPAIDWEVVYCMGK